MTHIKYSMHLLQNYEHCSEQCKKTYNTVYSRLSCAAANRRLALDHIL